jgi:hypothetical protein
LPTKRSWVKTWTVQARWWKGFMKLGKKNNGTTWSRVGKIGRVILHMHLFIFFLSSPCLSSTKCYQLCFFFFSTWLRSSTTCYELYFWLRCKMQLFFFYFLSNFLPACAAQQHAIDFFFDWDAKSNFQLRLLSHMDILIDFIFF